MTVLVDSSIWIDHFRKGNPTLADLLRNDQVLCHPLVIGELACGTPPDRGSTLKFLNRLGKANQASWIEVMGFIERDRQFGKGCGWIDMAILSSTLITPDARLWTLDKRLASLAQDYHIGFV